MRCNSPPTSSSPLVVTGHDGIDGLLGIAFALDGSHPGLVLFQLEPEGLAEPLAEPVRVSFEDPRLTAHDVAEHRSDLVPQFDILEHLLTHAVDRLTLKVHDLVVFEQALSNLKVVLFDLALGTFDGARDHR